MDVTSTISNVLQNTEGQGRILVLQELKKATKEYSAEAVKRALVESSLNEEQTVKRSAS